MNRQQGQASYLHAVLDVLTCFTCSFSEGQMRGHDLMGLMQRCKDDCLSS